MSIDAAQLSELLGQIIGPLVVALAGACSLPQLWRLVRSGSGSGVSLAALLNAVVYEFAWALYSLWISDGWLLATCLIALPGAIATAVAAWRCGVPRTYLWLPGLWAGVLLAAAGAEAVGAPAVLSVVLGASIVWQLAPAVAEAWRNADVSGIAAGTWWVFIAQAVLFGIYGIIEHVPALIIDAALILAGSSAVLLRIARGSSSAQDAATAPVTFDISWTALRAHPVPSQRSPVHGGGPGVQRQHQPSPTSAPLARHAAP